MGANEACLRQHLAGSGTHISSRVRRSFAVSRSGRSLRCFRRPHRGRVPIIQRDRVPYLIREFVSRATRPDYRTHASSGSSPSRMRLGTHSALERLTAPAQLRRVGFQRQLRAVASSSRGGRHELLGIDSAVTAEYTRHVALSASSVSRQAARHHSDRWRLT